MSTPRRARTGGDELVEVLGGLPGVVSGGNVASGSNLKQWTPVDSPILQWQAIDLGNGYYRLVIRTNGMAVDGWGSTTDGAPAQWTFQFIA